MPAWEMLENNVVAGATSAAPASAQTGNTYSLDSSIVTTVTANGGQYNYLGCYTDPGPRMRALNGIFTYYGAASVQQCASFCAPDIFMGLEAGGECYCGQSIVNGASRATCQNECYQSCEENAAERCGGYFRLSMYQLGGPNYTDSNPSAVCTYGVPVTTVTSATPALVYQGPITTASVVTQVTATNSAGLYTTFASTQYYCKGGCEHVPNEPGTLKAASSTSPTTAMATPVVQSRINTCGFVGCYSDDGADPALRYQQEQLDSPFMTRELCLNTCILRGYPYAGVKFGQQCFCGWSIGPASTLVRNGQLNADGLPLNCNDPMYACSGNSTEQCGGLATIDIWQCPLDATAEIASSFTTGSSVTSMSSVASGGNATASRAIHLSPSAYPTVNGYTPVKFSSTFGLTSTNSPSTSTFSGSNIPSTSRLSAISTVRSPVSLASTQTNPGTPVATSAGTATGLTHQPVLYPNDYWSDSSFSGRYGRALKVGLP
ncbi:hypothetical protein LTR62_001819 [Meristemomyces frigidus]|uniref:WSC domain-containing protein n=1 Tax=Meristemomyces frigidus TaxID=1508187 RepID=A0AAN7TN82_9PEZI|nr:hypothetical protein LTR62_001819 [Meristemomyces frigidus]